MLSKYTWYQRSRLRAIEVLSYWQGRINTRDLIDMFGISRQIAQSDMREYMNLAPGNLSYQKSERAYLVTSIFKLMITNGTIEEFLGLKSEGIHFAGAVHVEYVQQPVFHIDPVVFRIILQGIYQAKKLKIHYQSLNNPKGLHRDVFPLKLVYSGFRWHIRAYCTMKNDYRDFSLARIITASVVDEGFDYDDCLNKDVLWNEWITLEIGINPELSTDEKKLLQVEFGFTGNKLSLNVRKALVNYTLQIYQITVQSGKANPRRDRLVLKNHHTVSNYIW